MPQVRFLIDNPGAVWAYKDYLREQMLLGKDPVKLNRTMFNRWLELKAKVVLDEVLAEGSEDPKAEVLRRLQHHVTAWRRESARRQARVLNSTHV